jgi:hypothetical protein
MSRKICCTRIMFHSLCISLICISLICISLNIACQTVEPPSASHDPIAYILSSMKNKQWDQLNKYFTYPEQIVEFPLKKALDRKETWHTVRRIRMMDQHFIFDIDTIQTDHSTQCKRYTFWASLNEKQTSSQIQSTITNKSLKIIGWTQAKKCIDQAIELYEIEAPTRFSATSFRGVIHIKTLGILHQAKPQSNDLLWYIEQGDFNMTKRALKKRGCRRINLKKIDQILQNQIQTKCYPLLKQDIQRSYHAQQSKTWLAQRKVDVTDGKEWKDEDPKNLNPKAYLKSRIRNARKGKKSSLLPLKPIHVEQGIKSQSLSFSGKLMIQQDLSADGELRKSPLVKESMLIAPQFTQCVRSTLWQWSNKELPKSACLIDTILLVKVYKNDTQ